LVCCPFLEFQKALLTQANAANSNVDRLAAIWEVLHSDSPPAESWFDGTDARDKDSGNWAIKKNHPDLPSDDLRPFHKEGGTYWKSNDIRETAPLGYTYPELEKWKHLDSGKYDAAKHKKKLTEYLNGQYNSAARAAVKARLTADPHESDTGKPNLHQLLLTTPNPTPAEDIIGFPDYTVNVVYNRYDLSPPFLLCLVPRYLPYSLLRRLLIYQPPSPS
jgi:tyrosinase